MLIIKTKALHLHTEKYQNHIPCIFTYKLVCYLERKKMQFIN